MKITPTQLSIAQFLGNKNEQFFIDSYNPYFNECKIAGTPIGRKHSEETLKRMRLNNKPPSFKGKNHSEETKRKISISMMGKCTWAKGNKNKLGKTVSKNTRDKISKSLKGVIPWNKGKNLSQEHKINISKSMINNKNAKLKKGTIK